MTTTDTRALAVSLGHVGGEVGVPGLTIRIAKRETSLDDVFYAAIDELPPHFDLLAAVGGDEIQLPDGGDIDFLGLDVTLGGELVTPSLPQTVVRAEIDSLPERVSIALLDGANLRSCGSRSSVSGRCGGGNSPRVGGSRAGIGAAHGCPRLLDAGADRHAALIVEE